MSPNRLSAEKSPYLLQHADNPVDWRPWGKEAFEEAKRRNVPVFLSVGYSTCHWCHVMAHESFEDEEIAAFLNEHFVPVKVDREERPDVDAVHMKVVQALTGHGGWPMSVWLTPEGKPFYGGTYFPARDGDRGQPVGFLTILRGLARAYREEGEKVAARAERITEALRRAAAGRADPDAPRTLGLAPCENAAAYFTRAFDAAYGGWGGAPKFPRADVCGFLLRRWRGSGDARLLEQVETTLDKMARGGIRDHLAGGFHRYAVDDRWHVPHFEKMLYDNALLAVAYLEGFQATGREDFAGIARETLEYLSREMRAEGGAFYAAADADSPNENGAPEEGAYFVFTREEFDEVLGEDLGRIAAVYFRVGDPGNWEEDKNVLWTPRSMEDVAKELGGSVEALEKALLEAKQKLLAARSKRPPPAIDTKILASWNALAVSAFARASVVLDEPKFLIVARETAAFVRKHLYKKEGEEVRLFTRWADGEAKYDAYLDDYAFWIAAYLDLAEAECLVGEPARAKDAIAQAKALAHTVESRFADVNGGYYFTADDAERLIVREKPDHDGPTPCGNSVVAMNLLRLYALTGEDAYRASADAVFRAFAHVLREAPVALPAMLSALEAAANGMRVAVLVAGEGFDDFREKIARTFLPATVFLAGAAEDLEALSEEAPVAAGRTARDGRATLYLCRDGVCEAPTTEPGGLCT